MEAKLVESPTPTFHKSPTKARSLQNEMIGRYIVGAELGRGAFGAVFRGLDSLTGKTVAIKQIKLEKGQKPTEIQREIELLCQYEHDNIIKYYESVVIKTKLNIMLEYMENGSLSDIVEQFGVFPEALTATYIYQVLLGLQFLHSKNVIHKDIKSANILLAKDGTIKLADFGIALEITDQNTPLKGIQGSPFWMAPEVIKNEGFPTTKSDIWSIGCTVIELLTGSPPFGEESSVSVVWKIVEGEIESQFPIICSKELHDFLTKCFQRNVEERPSAEDLLKHEWIVNNIKGTIRPSLAEVRKTVQLHTRKSMLVNANNLNKYMQNKEAASLRPSDVLSLVNEKTPLVTSSPAASPAPSRMFESKGKQETETVAPIPFNLMTPPASPATSVKKETLPAGREVIQIPTGLPIRGLTAQITHSNTRKDGPKAWTEYFVVLQLGPLIWKVDKRYSNFVELHDRIKKYHSDVKLPVLPPKRRFGKMDEKFVSERREQLQKYFQDLIKIDIVLECRELKCFLIE